jgi:hypothetical protein
MIRRIFKNKSSGQLLLTIPVKSEFKEGDYVIIKKVKDE